MDPSPWNQPSGSVGRGDEYADTGRLDVPYGDYANGDHPNGDHPSDGFPSDDYEGASTYDYGTATYDGNGYAADGYQDNGAWSGTAATGYDQPQDYGDPRYDETRYNEPPYNEPPYNEPPYNEPPYNEPQSAAPHLTPGDEHAAPGDNGYADRRGDRPLPRRQGDSRGDGRQPDPGNAAPPKSRAGRNLPAAIGVGVVLAGAVLASLLIVKAAFLGVIVIAAGIACRELAIALRTNGTRVPLVPLLVGAVGLQVAAYNGGAQASGVAMALFVLVILVWRMAEGAENFLRDATAGVFVAIYVPFLASFAALMTAESNGARRVILFFLVTACSDTGGYAAGVLSGGKHPMAPTISPKKSWEGLVGSLITAAAGGAIGMHFMLHGQFWQGAVIGLCAVVSATLGDLAESMIKRDLGIKDMGNLLPGHGGLMDRMDSLLATAPVVWLLLAAFLGT